MKREIKGTIFIIKEIYKKTLVMEGNTWTDLAKFLLTLRKRHYTKPSLYWTNFNTLKNERISYRELYNYIREYSDDRELIKKFKKQFYV